MLYRVGEFIYLLILNLGILGTIIIALGLLATAAYLAALCARGFFWSSGKRNGILLLFKEVFYVLLVLPLLSVVLGRLSEYGLLLIWYLPIFAASIWNIYSIGACLQFNFLVAYSKNRSWATLMIKRLPLLALWLIMLLEIMAVVIINPQLPMLHWLVIVYSLALVILQTPLTERLILHLRGIQYVRILTTERTVIEGFLTHQDSSSCTILQKDRDLVVQSTYVRTMVPIDYREQKKEEESPYF